jgi:hypothetical protein
LYEVDPTTISFIPFFANWYNDRLIPLIRQFFLIPNQINECNRSEAVMIHLLLELVNAEFHHIFNLALAISAATGMGPSTNGSATCISICLTNVTD